MARRKILLLIAYWFFAVVCSSPAQVVTNLQQLTETLNAEREVFRAVNISATVCAASRPQIGVLILHDQTGTELVQLGDIGHAVVPGDQVRIQGGYCMLRKRAMGVDLCAAPVVNNDGTHVARTWPGTIKLKAGLIPLRLEWFNSLRDFNLEVYSSISNAPREGIESSNLLHAVTDQFGHTNFLPGLEAEAYEGYWESMPNFALQRPVKSGVVTNFDTAFRPRDEMFAVRFSGYLNVPAEASYVFRVRSDDGSLLFFGKPELPVNKVGVGEVPVASSALYGEAMQSLSERRWVEMQGRVSFAVERGEGLELELRSDRDAVTVRIADAGSLSPIELLNSRIRIRGVAQGVLTMDQRIVLGRVFVASDKDLSMVESPLIPPASSATTASAAPSPIVTNSSVSVIAIGEVKSLPIEEARRSLPVRIRGVVTDAKNPPYDRWISLQDDTRGIFVSLTNVPTFPAFGEIWEVEGHSGAGDFAPVVIADKMTFIGDGRVPEPARPSWTELVNGSHDVQWTELLGLVTAVHSNTMTLLLPEGRLDVRMDDFFESDLNPYKKSVVRIRGVLYAIWNSIREVRVDSVMMRNASVNVDIPAPADPFNAVLKTPRELLLFDAQATAFRRVKVRGQIVHANPGQLFLMEDGAGLRVVPAEASDVRVGDLVEAVGYPDIGQNASLSLSEVELRKTGVAPLPAARHLSESELSNEGLDSTLVELQGTLVESHIERGVPVLGMQSGTHLYLARLAPRDAPAITIRSGSRLVLRGVYVDHHRDPAFNTSAESFDLLLNSPGDITILSQPSWWTLQRMFIVVGLLLVILVFTAVWITQLRRLVEQRTAQLERETRERERIEREHALEAERSRIARDLHDDLGSSLTEISVLASTGQRPASDIASQTNLFHSIAKKARSLIAALDVIVWAVDPDDNSLQSLADYLSGYTDDFLSHTNISCRFKVPMTFPRMRLEGRVRHDLLLAVKETLNNIVRHSEATEVEFRMAFADGNLNIEIADNGKGFEMAGGDGHGLKNLSARLEKLGGSCAVESRVGGGTEVKIKLPLGNAAPAPAPNTTFD